MRASDLQRDDSVLPFTLFVSLLIHSIILLMVSTPKRDFSLPIEHIYPTIISYQSIPEPELFSAFSPTQKIYTTNREGVTRPTTGNRLEKQSQTRASDAPDKLTRGHQIEDPLETVETRKFYAKSSDITANAARPDLPSPTERPSPKLSATMKSPAGIVDDYDPTLRQREIKTSDSPRQNQKEDQLITHAENPSRISPDKKPGVPGTRGALDVPDPARIKVAIPQSGQTLADQVFEPPKSVGSVVAQDPITTARPIGESPPSLADQRGTRDRAIISKPVPEYPEWAERDQVQASVTFEVTITAEGRVSRTRLEVSSGYPELDRLAEESVRQWFYEPRPGQAERRRAQVQFVLRNKNTK